MPVYQGTNQSVRLRRTTGSMTDLLDTLARREAIGERSKDRALEKDRLRYNMAEMKQRGESQRAANKLQLLQANMNNELALKQADVQAARIQMEGAKVAAELAQNRQRMFIGRKQFELQVAQHEASMDSMRTTESINKSMMLRQNIEITDARQQRLAAKQVELQQREAGYGSVLSQIFVYQDPNTNEIKVQAQYKEMFKNLEQEYGKSDPMRIVNEHILPMFHANFQAAAAQELAAHNEKRIDGKKITDIMHRDVDEATRQRVNEAAMLETFGGMPSVQNPNGGLLIASAEGRLGRKAGSMRVKYIEKYGPEEGMKRYYAALLATHRDRGGFKEDASKVNVDGFADGNAALLAGRSIAANMVNGLYLRTQVFDGLPRYSSARTARESADSAYVELETLAQTYTGLLAAETAAVMGGNPDGLTPAQANDVGLNLYNTSQNSVTNPALTPEQALANLTKTQDQEAMKALLLDAQVPLKDKVDDPYAGVKAPSFGGKTDDYNYGLPDVLETAGDTAAFLGKGAAYGVMKGLEGAGKGVEAVLTDEDNAINWLLGTPPNSTAPSVPPADDRLSQKSLTGQPPRMPTLKGTFDERLAATFGKKETTGPKPQSRYSGWVEAAEALTDTTNAQ